MNFPHGMQLGWFLTICYNDDIDASMRRVHRFSCV